MFRFKPRGIRMQYAFPLVFAAFAQPPERRRQHASPILFGSVKSLAGFTSLFIPQIPIPDTSKIKDSILGKLPSWTTQSAASKFIRKPQADIVVGLSLEPKSFRVFVAYYPKGEEIIVRTGGDELEDEGWVELAKPELMAVDGWKYVASNGDSSFCPSTVQYTTAYPHRPLHAGHPMRDGLTKRYDAFKPEFLINFEDFIFADNDVMDNPGNKPPTFSLTNQQVMTDFARLIRNHVEDFIAREVLDRATLVNDEPVIKWMVMYPDVMDAQTSPGVTCKRDFITAFRNAGYPLDESDIPIPPPDEPEQGEEGYSHLEDLGTENRMVEFLSAGYAGLVGYASLQPINKHIPAIPQEKPFTTVIDDQLFLTTRMCLFTPEARFGVVHHPMCSATASPVFKQLPEEHINLIIRTFVQQGLIPHEPGVDVDISSDPKMVDFVSSHVITDWPESKPWKDAIDVLRGEFNRDDMVMETDPENHPSGIMRALKTSAIAFALMVSQGIGVATMEAFGAVHMNEPSMTDVVLFDSNRGEEDAYRAVLNWANIPKEVPRDIPVSDDAKPAQGLGELEEPIYPPIIVESPDYTKLMKQKDVETLGLGEEDVKLLQELSDSVGKFDKEKYRKLRIVRPQTDGIWLEVGLCEAVRLECARIFGDALRK